MMSCFYCNVHSHGFEVKEKESNFARNNRTYLEIVNNEWKIKSEIAKDYGLTLSTFSTI